jgi:4-hydroxy-tetrahydrodipicolinate synthase
MRSVGEIRACLHGPVCSVPTPFDVDGSIHTDGIRHLIDVAIAGGSQTVMLTWFDSLFPLLTDAEVHELTRLVVEHVNGRALVVAADRSWWTGQSATFAGWCRELGVDVIMVKPPVLGQIAPDQLIEHYCAVATMLPVMLVGHVPLETLPILLENAPGITAFKDDIGGNYGFQITRKYAQRLAVIKSGHLWEHMHLWQYGAVGWLSNSIVFAPSVDQTYWQALQSGRLDRARDVILKYDEPWWELAANFPGGPDNLWHATLELFEIAPRWRRSPFGACSDEDIEMLRQFYATLELPAA